MNITKESAEFFLNLCVSGYAIGIEKDGKLQQSPYCPVVQRFVSPYLSCGANDNFAKYSSNFAQFCRAVADKLEEKTKC